VVVLVLVKPPLPATTAPTHSFSLG